MLTQMKMTLIDQIHCQMLDLDQLYFFGMLVSIKVSFLEKFIVDFRLKEFYVYIRFVIIIYLKTKIILFIQVCRILCCNK